MTWDAVGALGEVFGATAVVVSVIYLAIQVRKQIQESRLSATRELHEHYQNLLITASTDENLTSLYHRAVQDYESLPNVERLRMSLWFQSIFRHMEQVFLHTTKGNLDPGFFRSIDSIHMESMTYPGVQQWWDGSKDFFDKGFRDHTERVLERAKKKGYTSSFKTDEYA